jgi:spore germination cell wall hydrolase CwlJ-like protein
MIIRRLRLSVRILIGVPTLLVAASCVPGTVRPAPDRAPQPVATTEALLKGLALELPAEVANQRLDTQASPVVLAGGAPPFDATAQSAEDSDRALECLTAAVYYEARSEQPDGQRAVAQVVLNRVRDRAFPRSVCGVVYQGSHRRTGCQFSFTCDGSMLRRRDESSWQRAREVAAAALGGAVFAPVGAATSYHASYMLPWWAPSLTRIGTVGAHIFYRWRNAMERTLTFRQSYAGYEPSVSGGGQAAGGVGEVTAGASGVTVHYEDGGDVAGVTVHRGGSPADTLATATPQRPAQPMMVSGVRIHRGVAPIDADHGNGETADAI